MMTRSTSRKNLSAAGVRRAAGAAVVATVLAACGSTSPSATSSASPQERVATTTTPSGSPATAVGQWSADGASFGVDSTTWPASMAGARTVLAALPEELRGRTRDFMPTLSDSEDGDAEPEAGDLAAVAYGEDLSVLVSDDAVEGGPGASPQVVGAQPKLAAMFGLGYVCDPDTYEGTIASSPEYPVPGTAAVDPGTPAWFSCRIDGAEGAEDFSAQAVGWTSGTTAWLAVGADDAAVRALVTAMHHAKG